eukprot:4568073-Pleurochrysis_carterae.AAC.2
MQRQGVRRSLAVQRSQLSSCMLGERVGGPLDYLVMWTVGAQPLAAMRRPLERDRHLVAGRRHLRNAHRRASVQCFKQGAGVPTPESLALVHAKVGTQISQSEAIIGRLVGYATDPWSRHDSSFSAPLLTHDTCNPPCHLDEGPDYHFAFAAWRKFCHAA